MRINKRALQKAIETDDDNYIRKLFSNPEFDCNVQYFDHETTCLHLAVQSKSSKVIKALLERPDIHSTQLEQALRECALTGNLECIELLLNDKRIDPTTSDDEGDTALHYAASTHNLEVLRKLLDDGRLNPNQRNKKGHTYLKTALKSYRILRDPDNLVTLCSLDNGRNLNKIDKHGNTILHYAIEHDFGAELVKSLLTLGGLNPNQKNYHRGEAPLHVASKSFRSNYEDAEELLKNNRVDPNIQDLSGRTSLHIAVKGDNTRLVEALLQNPKTDPNQENDNRETPVDIAMGIGHVPLKLLIADQRVDPNPARRNFLQTAIWKGYHGAIDILLNEPRVDPNHRSMDGRSALDYLCASGVLFSSSILIKFLDHERVDPNSTDNKGNTWLHNFLPKLSTWTRLDQNLYRERNIIDSVRHPRNNLNQRNNDGDTPLHIATKEGDVSLVKKLLVDFRVNPTLKNNKGHIPLNIVLLARRGELIEALKGKASIRKRSNPSVLGDNAVHEAVSSGNLEKLEELLNAGKVDPNHADIYGMTPLHYAIYSGNMGALKALLTHPKINPNLNDFRSHTPLDLAVEFSNEEATKILISSDKIVPYAESDGGTLLHYAVEIESLFLLELLLENGRVNPNQADKNGVTPLDYAFKLINRFSPCRDDMIERLLGDKRINVLQKNAKGKSFLSKAMKSNDEKIKELLWSMVPFSALAYELMLSKQRIDYLSEQGIIDIDGDDNVTRANSHFTEVIEPHVRDKFESYGANDEERIIAIEREIKQLILSYISNNYQPSPAILAFIQDNQDKLILATEERVKAKEKLKQAEIEHQEKNDENSKNELEKAKKHVELVEKPLKDAVEMFKDENAPAYAAWRGYNPCAPTKGSYANLLTHHADDGKGLAFSTPAASVALGDNRTNFAASHLIRKRVAHYYLVAIDTNHPDNVKDRIEGFIKILSNFRNAHDIDDPMCFPGTLTVMTEMGDKHPVCELKHPVVELIQRFLKKHLSNKFREALEKMETIDARDELFESLTCLTTDQAEEYLNDPNQRIENEKTLHIVREEFSMELADDAKTLMEMAEVEIETNLEGNWVNYFRHFMLDPAYQHTRRLHKIMKEYDNVMATSEMINHAMSHFEGQHEDGIYRMLFKASIAINDSMTERQLKDLQNYLSARAIEIIAAKGVTKEALKGIIQHVIDIMGLEGNVPPDLEPYFDQLKHWGLLQIENPYHLKAMALQEQLLKCHPNLKPTFAKNLDTQEQKSALFNELLAQFPLDDKDSLVEKVEKAFDRKRKAAEEIAEQAPAAKRIKISEESKVILPLAELRRSNRLKEKEDKKRAHEDKGPSSSNTEFEKRKRRRKD